MHARRLAALLHLSLLFAVPILVATAPLPAGAVRSSGSGGGDASQLEERIVGKFETITGWVKKGAIALMAALTVQVGYSVATGNPQAWRKVGYLIVGGTLIAMATEIVEWIQN